jgi:hypothetical protein
VSAAKPLPESYLLAAEFMGKSLVAQGGVTYELAGMDLQELTGEVRRLQTVLRKIGAFDRDANHAPTGFLEGPLSLCSFCPRCIARAALPAEA